MYIVTVGDYVYGSTCNIYASHHDDRLSNVTDAFFNNFFSLKKAYQYM